MLAHFSFVEMSSATTINTANPSLKLFCFHDAGGNRSLYQNWISFLAPEIELCAIELSGRDGKLNANVPLNLEMLIDHLANEIIPKLQQPYAFFGHSMGAMISYLLTIKLLEKKVQTPKHLFLSAFLPPHVWPSNLDSLNNVAKKLASQMNSVINSVLYNDLKLLSTLINQNYYSNTIVTTPITAFIGQSDNFISPELMKEWKRYTTQDFNLNVMAGDHFYLQRNYSIVIQQLKADLIC